MERPQIPETATELLSTKLESIIQCAKLVKLKESKDQGKEMFCLQITDQEKWQSRANVEKLIPYFGQAALQVWSDRENPEEVDINDPETKEKAIESFTKNELGINNTTFVIAENGKLAGFLTGTEGEVENRKVFNLALSFVSPEQRGKGTAKELYRSCFEGGNYEAVLGCSSTPAAVKLRLKMGKEFGYTGFYAGYKDGILGTKGTPEQQDLVRKFSKYIQKDYAETAIPIEESPENYLVIKADVEPIPPLKEENLHFKEGDSLAPVFYDDVLTTQNKLLPHTVYGMLINLRDEVLPEEA